MQEPALTRAEVAKRQRWIAIAVLLAPAFIFWAVGGVRAAPRPNQLVLETALGSAMLAVAAVVVGLNRRYSMLGPPKSWLLSVVLGTPSSLLLWRVLEGLRYPGMMAEWAARPGLRCLLLSGALSFVPIVGLLWMRRGTAPLHPKLSSAALASAVGAVTWVLVDLWCPVGYVPHLLIGHVLPLVLLTLLSARFGSRVVQLRLGANSRSL